MGDEIKRKSLNLGIAKKWRMGGVGGGGCGGGGGGGGCGGDGGGRGGGSGGVMKAIIKPMEAHIQTITMLS